MRLILLMVGILTAGAVGITQGVVPPPAQMLAAIFAHGGDPAQIRTANAAPVETRVMPQILRGSRTEDMGFHWSAVTLPPETIRNMSGFPVNVGTRGLNGFGRNAGSQIRQSNLRMQDMTPFARNQSAWNSAPMR